MKKSESIHSFVFLFILVIAIGAIFLYSNVKFTGYAVHSQYTNQSDCEAHNYTWEEITNQTCTDVIVPVNETYDCEPCLEYDIINETTNETGDCISWTSCVNETTTTTEDCETVVIGGQCVGTTCDSANLDLCLTETDCTNVSGYWYSDVCNAQAQCVPTTCSALSRTCGSASDGCGGTLSCGSCDVGYSCSGSGTCQVNQETTTTGCGNGQCGVDETCSNCPSDCGVCVAGEVTSCVPQWECGDWGECIDGAQTRTCNDLSQCDYSALTSTETQTCAVETVAETPAETCFDGIQNQDETGIDCGGETCQSCSVFSMVGNAVSGPILASKDFLFGSIPRTVISTLVLLLLIGGIVAFKILSDRGFTIKEFTGKIIKFKDKLLSQKFSNLPKSESNGY